MRDVVVDGKVVVRDGHCLTVDEDDLRVAARDAQRSLLARAGIEVPHRWPQR